MSNIAPGFITVSPSFIIPEIIMPISQASSAFECLPSGDVDPRLSDGDLQVYAKRIDVRTEVAAGQSAYNSLPSISTTLSLLGTPTYLIRVRGEYDHHDTAAMSRWGLSIVETQRLGMRQGHFQIARNMLLYGMNPALGEGLLNADGATSIDLPPDPNGNTSVATYDNGAMAQFFLQQIAQLKSRTNQLGIGHDLTILGPQRILGSLEYNIVQVTQFQREGAGTASTAGTVKTVALDNGDTITWAYDDTLEGKGSGGKDAVLLVMTTVENPKANSKINTNIFATLQPGLEACTLQLSDMVAPREIPTPLPGGAIDVVSEWRLTSGWPIRPEAITIISMAFED